MQFWKLKRKINNAFRLVDGGLLEIDMWRLKSHSSQMSGNIALVQMTHHHQDCLVSPNKY